MIGQTQITNLINSRPQQSLICHGYMQCMASQQQWISHMVRIKVCLCLYCSV